MSQTRHRKLFVNLPVSDLARTKAFFGELGFTFDARFTDDKAACMVLSTEAWVMLLERSFFQTFTKRELCDSTKATEALLAISCDTRAEVDTFADRALSLGATVAMPPQDHGFMYFRTFYDLDGHHWEIMWMAPKAAEGPPPQA